MRRLLLALPLCIPFYAHAQQAANPVEPFSYGVRTGTPLNPLHAVLSSVVPSAQAGSTQAAAPVELFSYGRRVGTKSNPIYVNLDLSAYLTTSAAAAEYVPIQYGTNGRLLSGEYHYANGGVFTDPATGVAEDAKFGGKGIATAALRVAGPAIYLNLTGTGNAPLCLNSAGQAYRGTSAGCQ